MMYYSTKTYKDLGPVAFRQWRADSHCNLLHGYSMSFKFVFGAAELDERNWVMDFGGLKNLKSLLEEHFDHRVLVAHDDPELDWFRAGQKRGICKLTQMDDVGCEAVAEIVFQMTEQWLIDAGQSPRVFLVSVEAKEHEKNSALYIKKETL